MKVVSGALELDPSDVAGSVKDVPAEHGPQTDHGRLEKLRRWDPLAWTQFFKEYESKIITLCTAMTRDQAIAEDICADTFVRVVSSIDKFRGNSSIKTWIYTIARNLCLTHLARAKPTVSLDDEIADTLPDRSPGARNVSTTMIQPGSKFKLGSSGLVDDLDEFRHSARRVLLAQLETHQIQATH